MLNALKKHLSRKSLNGDINNDAFPPMQNALTGEKFKNSYSQMDEYWVMNRYIYFLFII